MFLELFTSYLLPVFVLILIWKWFQSYRNNAEWRKIPAIPGRLPFFGNSFSFLLGGNESIFKTLVEYCDHRYPLRSCEFAGERYVMFYKAPAVEALLSHKTNISKSWDYKFLHDWLGTGLLTSTGSKWFHRRKLLTPTFHFKILEDFLDVFNSQSNVLISKLQQEIGNEKGFDITKYISLCTLDIICETAMGKQINAQSNTDSEYVKAVQKISEIIHRRQSVFWMGPDVIFNLTQDGKDQKHCLQILHGFTNEVIRERKLEIERNLKNKSPKTNNDVRFGVKRRMALLDLLLEASTNDSSNIDDDGIREEVDTFMFEGHDTTAAGINWAIYLLGLNPQHQKLVHDELDSIFGDSDRPATSTDLSEMKYLDLCIKESQRLYPSVPFFGRSVTEQFKIGDFTIPAGSSIPVATYSLHRDPDVFPDPEVFDPDRFLPENTQQRNPYAYVPFSAGSRNCIGQKFAIMEEKTVLSTFLRHFAVTSLVEREDLILLGELILSSKNPLLVKIKARK